MSRATMASREGQLLPSHRRLAGMTVGACLVLAAMWTLGCSTQSLPMIAVRNVTIVDVIEHRAVPNQTILVRGDRIVEVGPESDVEIPAAAEIVDAEGMFAVPGLVDLHVHMEADDLPLFLANGITTVREMNGSSEILELRRAVQSGERTGPTMYVAGPLMAGVEQQWRHQLIQTDDEAREEVIRQAEMGFDFVKVYDGLRATVYQTIVEVADSLGLPVLGHIPETVGLADVVSHSQMTIEHIEQLVRATAGHNLDLSQLPTTVTRVKDGGIAIVPTLAAMEILSARRSAWFDSLFERLEMRYTPPSVRPWWESLRRRLEAGGELDPVAGGAGDWIQYHRELTMRLAEGGVPILVGTDTPNPLLVPGFSIHHELEALVRAGLESSFVLEAATHGAAVHLRAEDEFGAISPGLRADIVLVAGNPLEDLAHLREVRGLVLRGAYLTQDDLNKSLESVALLRAP